MCRINKEERLAEVVAQEDPVEEDMESDAESEAESEAPSEPILHWLNNGPLDLFTLLDVHQLLDGYDVGNNKLVCKKWDWYLGSGENRLPRKVLSKLHVVQRQVRHEEGVRRPIEVEITGKKGNEVFDVAFTAPNEDALWTGIQHHIPNSYIASFHMSSIAPTPFLLGSITAAAGNIAVGSMKFDYVSFLGLMNHEFWMFIFGFKGISSMDLEKAVVLPQQLNNTFLARIALKGVNKLRLPRAYPTNGNRYDFDLGGLTTFLRNAPADQGVIELSAYFADFTLDQESAVPRFRDVLKRPHAALKVYVYDHRLDPEFRRILLAADGHESAPPVKRSKFTRSQRLQIDCETSSLRASTQSLPF